MENKEHNKNITLISLLLLFSMFIYLFYGSLENFVGLLGLIPILLSSFLYGRRGGVIVAVAVTLILFGFSAFLNVIPVDLRWSILIKGITGVFIGFVVGNLQEESDKLKKLEKETLVLKLGIEKSTDIVFATNSEGYFTYVNPAFTKVYGYSFQEIKGKTPRILKSGYRDGKFYQDFWKKIKEGTSIQIKMKNMTKDGRMLEIESSVNPVVNDFGVVQGFLAIQRDITERERMEIDLIRRTNDLERLNSIMVDRELKMIEMKKKINKSESS